MNIKIKFKEFVNAVEVKIEMSYPKQESEYFTNDGALRIKDEGGSTSKKCCRIGDCEICNPRPKPNIEELHPICDGFFASDKLNMMWNKLNELILAFNDEIKKFN